MAYVCASDLFPIVEGAISENTEESVMVCLKGNKVVFLQMFVLDKQVLVRIMAGEDSKWLGHATQMMPVPMNAFKFFMETHGVTKLFFLVQGKMLKITDDFGNTISVRSEKTFFEDGDGTVAWKSGFAFGNGKGVRLSNAIKSFYRDRTNRKKTEEAKTASGSTTSTPEGKDPNGDTLDSAESGSASATSAAAAAAAAVASENREGEDDWEKEDIEIAGGEFDEKERKKLERVFEDGWVEFTRTQATVVFPSDFDYSMKCFHESGTSKGCFGMSTEIFCFILDQTTAKNTINVFLMLNGMLMFESDRVCFCVSPLWTIIPPKNSKKIKKAETESC